MATTNTWDQVVQKITGVANRGAFSKTYTPTTSRQTQNGSAGYYSSITTVCNAVSLSGNASTSQVLTGRTFYTTSLTRQTGTMANRGAVSATIYGGNVYTIPAGYHNGSGKIQCWQSRFEGTTNVTAQRTSGYILAYFTTAADFGCTADVTSTGIRGGTASGGGAFLVNIKDAGCCAVYMANVTCNIGAVLTPYVTVKSRVYGTTGNMQCHYVWMIT